MTGAPHRAEPPSPAMFLGQVIDGGMMGFFPAFLIFLALRTDIAKAMGIFAIMLVFAALYQAMGWSLVMGPFYLLRWIWRKLTGRPATKPEPPKAPKAPRHWVEKAGFWSGFVLIILLMLRASLPLPEEMS